MQYSLNAIMTKCRALYGKRLTKQNYDDLVNCSAVNEIVSYLKNKTAYAPTFDSANSDMNSSQIEELLKIHTLESFEKIGRYEISTSVEFYKYFIIKNDIQQILRYLNFLIIGKPEDYLAVLPPFFNKRSELDLYKLAQARSFNEMINSLKGTEYSTALVSFENDYKKPESYLKMECALDQIIWNFESEVVRAYSGTAREKIEEIIGYQNDMENLIRIYRLKRLAAENKETIQSYLNLNYTHFTKKNIADMLEQSTASGMLEEAAGSYYSKYFNAAGFTSLEDFTQRILYNKFYKEIRYSTIPVAVMLCYFFLAQNEVKNIIHIVQGVRNGVSSQAIKSLLVGAEN